MHACTHTHTHTHTHMPQIKKKKCFHTHTHDCRHVCMHTYPPLPTPILIRWRWTKLHTTGIMPTWHTHARWKARAQPAAALRWMLPPSRGSSQSQTRPGMGTSSQRTCALSATTTHSSHYLWCLKQWIAAKCLKIIQVKWTTHLHLSW